MPALTNREFVITSKESSNGRVTYDEYKDDKPDDESEEDYLVDGNLIVVDDEDLIAKIEEK